MLRMRARMINVMFTLGRDWGYNLSSLSDTWDNDAGKCLLDTTEDVLPLIHAVLVCFEAYAFWILGQCKSTGRVLYPL